MEFLNEDSVVPPLQEMHHLSEEQGTSIVSNISCSSQSDELRTSSVSFEVWVAEETVTEISSV